MNKLMLLYILQASCVYAAKFQIENIVYTQEQTKREDIDSIESEEIDQIQPSSLDDILRLEVGATTTGGPRSSSEAPQIRGLEANKIFIYIDGVPQEFQTDHSSMIMSSMEEIKEINIHKTSSDSSKSGGIGGGITFLTKNVKDYLLPGKKNGLKISSKYHSASDEKIISAKTFFERESYSGLIGLSYQVASNLRLNDNSILENSAYKDFSALLKLNFQDLYEFKYEFFRREDTSPLNPTLNPPDNLSDLQADSVLYKNSLSIKRKLKQGSVFTYFNEQILKKERRSDNREEKRSIYSYGFSYDREDYGLKADFDKLSGEAANSYPDASGYKLGAYYQRKFNFDKWTLSPGIRGDFYELHSNEFDNSGASNISSKLESSYNLNNNTFRVSASEGFNSPGLTEVYPNGLHHKGDGFFIADNYFITNTNLKHETSQMLDVSYSYESSLFSYNDLLKITYGRYWNEAKNYIYFEKIDRAISDGINGTTQFINIPEVYIHGEEASVEYIVDIYDFKINYSKVRGWNKTLGIYLASFPADQINVEFKAYFDSVGLTLGYLGIKALRNKRVNPETLERTDPTGEYFIHNIFLTKKINKSFQFNFRVDNAMNRKYRKHASHIYESERDYKFGLTYLLNSF